MLTGGAGNDTLAGGLGGDSLFGGTGVDDFVFDSVLNAKSNVDKVMDFSHVDGDVLALSATIFGALSGGVASQDILSGAGKVAAETAAQHLIYNGTTGNLYYDPDGYGAAAATLFATIDQNGSASSHPTTLAASDFSIVS